jgi:hypothetical protein
VHLYVNRARDADNVELLLSYLHKGRLKRVRLYANPGEVNFQRLVEALLTRRPDIDIGHLDVHQAYVRLGSRELEWLVIPGVMGIALLIVSLLFAPILIHGVDGGHAELTVAQLASGDLPDTWHLTIRGQAQVDRVIRAVDQTEHAASRAVVWIPLVEPGTPIDRPVDVIMESRVGPGDLEALAAADRFDGILRDVWWEGLAGGHKRTIVASGVQLSPTVKLFHQGVHPRDELLLAIVVIGFLSFILVVVAVVLWKRAYRPPTRASDGARPQG